MTLKSDVKFEEKLAWFEKWHEELGKFSPEHSKVWKLGLWWGPFVQSRKRMSLEFTEDLCIMTMKNDAKCEEELTCISKLTWWIWRILTWALENLKSFLFNWLLWPKYIMFELKKYRAITFDGTKDRCKILRKTDLCMPSKITWGIWQICIG